jgi:hypothetical protein
MMKSKINESGDTKMITKKRWSVHGDERRRGKCGNERMKADPSLC